MADYTLPEYMLSRVRYFDGEYLKDAEFIDEQKYHIDRRRRHDRLLHVAGVCDGLVPSLAGGAIKITPGTAVDDLGRQILVSAERTVAVPAGTTGTLNIELLFNEVEARPSDVGGGTGGKTRFEQAPILQLSGALTARAVVLGQAVVTGGAVSQVTTAGRVYSGVRLPGPGAASSLRALETPANTAELSCSLKVTGNQTVTGTLAVGAGQSTIAGSLKVDGALSVGAGQSSIAGSLSLGGAEIAAGALGFGSQNRQMLNLFGTTHGVGTQDSTLYLRAPSNFALYRGGTHQSGALDAGGGKADLVVKNGDVGIGTTAPAGQLDVRVPGAGAWDRFVVTASDFWGDGPAQKHVTIGAGGASGIMLYNPHVSWYAPEARASIRYGRSGGVPTGRFWDVGVRANNAFSIAIDNAVHPIWIHENGNIGIFTNNPQARLSLVHGNRQLSGTVRSHTFLTNSGQLGQGAGSEIALASFGFESGNESFFGIRAHRFKNGSDWTSTLIWLGMDVDNTIRANGAGVLIWPNGNVEVRTNFVNGSSREWKDHIDALSGQEASALLEAIDPVTFHFKVDGEKRRQAGFIAEDMPELVRTEDGKGIAPVNILAVLTRVVKRQQETIDALEKKLGSLQGGGVS